MLMAKDWLHFNQYKLGYNNVWASLMYTFVIENVFFFMRS